jgi:hypothetical protein
MRMPEKELERSQEQWHFDVVGEVRQYGSF